MHKGSGKLKVMVKDTIDIQGLKTIAGSKALLEVEPAHDDAEVVKNILKAGLEVWQDKFARIGFWNYGH